MSRHERDGRDVHGALRRAVTPCSAATVGASTGRVEQALRARVPARLRLAGDPGHVHAVGRRPGAGDLAGVRDRAGAGAVRRAAGEHAVVLRERARRPRIHPLGAAHARRRTSTTSTPRRTRRRRSTAKANSRANWRAGRNDQRVGRLVGRGRLPEVRADDELRGGPDAGRRARLPRRDGRGGAARTSPKRRASAWNGCCGCGTTKRARSTTRWASARATRARSATTTSGACRRQTTRSAARDPADRFIRHRPVFRAGPAGLAGQPQPGGTRRGRVRAVLSGVRAHAPGTRRPLPDRGRAHLRTGGHRPAGATC